MKNLFSRILKVYDERDFLLYQKAKVIASLTIIILILTFANIIVTIAIQVRIKPAIIMLESVVLFYGIAALVLLRRGFYHISAHGIILAIMIAVWSVMFLDRAHIVSRLDTIAYILGIMTLTSIAVIRRKWLIILYGVLNQIVLIIFSYIFLFLPAETPFIANSSKYDYLLDNTISLIFITFVAYKVFSINQKALQKAQEEITRRQYSEEQIREKNNELAATNEELEATNEELQATMEELEASNEEFEATNEELTTAYRNLEENEERFRTMIDLAPYPITMSEQDGTITYLNRTFNDVFGYTHEDLPHLDQWWERAYPDPVYREKVRSFWEKTTQEALEENRAITPQEWVVTCKDGSMRQIEFRMVPIGDISFVVMDDLTEKKITQEMMIQSEKMMTVGSLAAGMAHEINNPLGIILQGIQNTLRRVDPGNARNDVIARECGTAIRQIHGYLEKQNILSYLAGIREAGNRAAKIVASMLQFSRKSDSEMKSVDLNTLIEQTLEIAAQDYDLKKSYDFKKLSVIKNFGPAIPAIRCIETEIEQVILNLLKNAAQAMSEIQDPAYIPEIHITTAQDGEFALLQVYDNGPGMGEETIKHIFEPFYTTKSVGTGTGLGLSVSYFIITNNHGGEISAESEKGQGSTFTIKIPLAWRMHG